MLDKILVDTREKTPLFTGAKVIKLDTGDYTFEGYEHELAIERKSSVYEFARNITEKRFNDWVRRLAEFKHAYMVCEFTLDDVAIYPKKSGVPPRARRYIRVKPPFIFKMLAIVTGKHTM